MSIASVFPINLPASHPASCKGEKSKVKGLGILVPGTRFILSLSDRLFIQKALRDHVLDIVGDEHLSAGLRLMQHEKVSGAVFQLLRPEIL